MKFLHCALFGALSFSVFNLTVAAIAQNATSTPVYPAPKSLGDTTHYGRNIQRTMRLLATSTPQKRNTVRILFYGQSITEQKWAQLVADDLRRRFPDANLIIENRALGGFASQMLVKTAETDLYSFQPDLLIFHVLGAHDKYEDIIRRTRERTCAEILQQTDHVTKESDLTEETDPAKLPPRGDIWPAFMNHTWLPTVSKRYGTELCDQRSLWKQYLTDYNLKPADLLKDGVHLNAHGEFVMAEFVKAYLRYDPQLGPSPTAECVKTYEVGKDVRWQDGKLRFDFEGNRVDVILKDNQAAPAPVLIDGVKPSAISSLYGFTRALSKPGGKWPPIADLSWQKTPLLETWTMEVAKDQADEKLFTFTLNGSKTGPDGTGRSDQKFVSNSGRIVIDPEDWNVAYALSLPGIKPVPDKFTISWQVVPHFVDEIQSPGDDQINPAIESTVTLAQGLTNARHTLEISGNENTPITAIRVYRPSFGRQ